MLEWKLHLPSEDTMSKRWNGWGEAGVDYPLPTGAQAFLADMLGAPPAPADATLASVLAGVPPSRLEAAGGVSTDPLDRLLHAHGQSLPDWIALRSGKIGRIPDAVAYPTNAEQVRQLMLWAAEQGLKIIPYGGGTSVVGHINPVVGEAPVLTLDLGQMNRLLGIDPLSRLARFEAGATGPAIERKLNELGYTLGHFPQSWEYSTLGGWIAARSSGQQSYRYGRIEQLFAGGSLETPSGALVLPSVPASAAGPDLRQLVLGSEGRLGVLTEASVRIQPLPEREQFLGLFFHSWDDGLMAARTLVQEDIPISMLRLSDAVETETTLALAGHERVLDLGRMMLALFGYGGPRCLMILGFSGAAQTIGGARNQALEVARSFGGLNAGLRIGEQWRRSRFKTPYLRNSLWELGYALDTLETALPWEAFEAARQNTLQAIKLAFASIPLPLLVFSHLSHVYADGAGFYITYLFPRGADPDSTLAAWLLAKEAASKSILAGGGTISHQHGIGLDHRSYLPEEKGRLGLQLLRSAAATLDPHGVMNPGKLFEDGPAPPG
jgi:alkyldihydroxyacetonephosphate synthase